MQTKVSDLRQRLAKKDHEREKEKEREREEISRIAKQKNEKPAPKALPQMAKELLSDLEKKKISTYFRYKIFSLSKLIEDKVRNNGLIGKGAKVLKSRPGNSVLLSAATSDSSNKGASNVIISS